jgi:hypothetical protein
LIKHRNNPRMNSVVVVFIVFFVLCVLAPLLTRAGDLDDRSRRGWWSNH